MITPSGGVGGSVTAPVSKSYMQRACAVTMPRGGITEILDRASIILSRAQLVAPNNGIPGIQSGY